MGERAEQRWKLKTETENGRGEHQQRSGERTDIEKGSREIDRRQSKTEVEKEI